MTRSPLSPTSASRSGATVFWAAAALVGTVGPWLLFGSYFATEGFHLPRFAADLFVNGAAGGFALDVMISILVFLVWSWSDSGRHGLRRWWWVLLPLSFLVGLSSSLPVYLLLRARRRDGAERRLDVRPVPAAPSSP